MQHNKKVKTKEQKTHLKQVAKTFNNVKCYKMTTPPPTTLINNIYTKKNNNEEITRPQ